MIWEIIFLIHILLTWNGKPRIINNTIDIGAFEFGKVVVDCNLYSSTVYVDSSDGFLITVSWSDAFTDLQDALAVVRLGCADTVKVAQGVLITQVTLHL